MGEIKIEIDEHSGFCFGVIGAIAKAEEELAKEGKLYCLGDIVHNEQEVNRLKNMGLVTITRAEFATLHNVKVLLRAHGEPPSTYEIAKKNNITLVDATCPVVLQLQSKIKKTYHNKPSSDTQIVVFGQEGHAEVIGLLGQTDNKGIVIETEKDLHKIDFSKKINLFSQTTKSLKEFYQIVTIITKKIHRSENFVYSDTICRQVSHRIPNINTFAKQYDIIIFVSGNKSSNGRILFDHCKEVNPNTYMIADTSDIKNIPLKLQKKIGICGATSTPRWLMEKIATELRKMNEVATLY